MSNLNAQFFKELRENEAQQFRLGERRKELIMAINTLAAAEKERAAEAPKPPAAEAPPPGDPAETDDTKPA